MRLIDADELIKEFLNVCRTEFEIKNKCMANENVLSIIQNAPTVEPTITCKECDGYEAGYSAGQHDARPHGEWINREAVSNTIFPFWERYECNKCHKHNSYSNFCPNCGADMRGGRE